MAMALPCAVLVFLGSLLRVGSYPMTGPAVPQLSMLDKAFPPLLRKWDAPGASVAVVRNGRLVFARGYGYKNSTTAELSQPDTQYRVCSLSKTLTTAAVLLLIAEGKLSWDTKIFQVLTRTLKPAPGRKLNEELLDITVEMCLQHSGGWDSDVAGDRMCESQLAIAEELFGDSGPSTCQDVIRTCLLTQR